MSNSVTEGDAPGILYISYDGMLESLGQSQVVAYLERLAPGRRIHLISFEKAGDWADMPRRNSMRERLETAGIAWHPLRYTKRPPVISTLWDMVRGAWAAMRLSQKYCLSTFHGRNMLCAAMAMPARRLRRGVLIADIRGFWADERVDGGIVPPNGLVHRVLKRLERVVMRSADRIVTLTEASVEPLRSQAGFGNPTAPIIVIPTCADLDHFTIQGDRPDRPFVLGYVGSIGTWYLLDEMLECFRQLEAKEPGARLLFVNRREQAVIREGARRFGIAQAIEIVSADYKDMPRQIARMSAGMALIKPSFSKIASAPTKLAEYLGCGVPCLGNQGVGDVGSVLERNCVGIVVNGFSRLELSDAVGRLVDLARAPGIRQRCRAVALDQFSLDSGVDRYDALYRSLQRP